VPAYGVSWPKGARPRAEWPATLVELAELILQEVQTIAPAGPYLFAGHSFGAAVCLQMAQLAEARGIEVAMVALLDPRSLPPITADIGGTFGAAGLSDTLALLSETAAEGSRFSEQFDEVSKAPAADRDSALRRILNPAAQATLEHVHETSQWFATLLADAGREGNERKPVKAKKLLLRAAETWLRQPAPSESRSKAAVRTTQTAIFQTDGEVVERVAAWVGSADSMTTVQVPGGHFAMLHEPHVAVTALRLCHAVVETGALDVEP